jgi:ATP-dependent exoDNAse (exonuclease V) beta subunit
VRERLRVLSPSEALDQVLASLDVVHLCARWPDAPQRVANLDALRGIASGYEDRCAQEREAGTVAGLLRYFDDMSATMLRRDEVIASDDQHVPADDGAVIVCTYHRAKGLEWPVVVMSSLDRAARRDAFEVCPEAEGAGFDPKDPLAGRWIRYWPWPLGALKKAPLADYADASAEGQRVAGREEKERARLLYVGFTRARDHLVLAARVKNGVAKCEWLDALADAAGTPLLTLPAAAADGTSDVLRIRMDSGKTLDVPARVWRLDAAAPVVADAPTNERRWFARARSANAQLVSYRISPSNAAVDWPDLVMPTIGEIVTLPVAMPLDAKVAEHNVLGDAVHAFFATDVDGLTGNERVDRARRLLASVDLVGVVRPDALVDASDRLRAFVEQRWPGAIWHREVAVDTYVPTDAGERRVSGVIDLLLQTRDGYVIFDHKTFPARSEAAWRTKVAEFLPQFAAYAEALQRTGQTVTAGWVHLPIGGGMVEALITCAARRAGTQ